MRGHDLNLNPILAGEVSRANGATARTLESENGSKT